MKSINREISVGSTHDLEAIKASLDDIETKIFRAGIQRKTSRAGIQLATCLIGAASEAISDELRTKQQTSLP